eukprot:CAMPEP_0176488730 /NCGR_PEP_ID=MMETSP0200_2-20121128/6876_1 /TAXON_ID=947934 /ORGANISM="Chaetoceros sp., Strain GSL56" /LENGTH=1050 /DNA_ID=CAMNT_0017885755 /DNA_START=410 /DNA_END=3562 /DNA_ORIENTATION=+
MVYSATIPVDSSDDSNQGGNDGEYTILEWNSPLSRNPEATRMEVEVVGIYTEKDEAKGSCLPSMAMVVVKKMNVKDDTNALMMKRLFDDSESRILKALDRVLDDLVDGKVTLQSNSIKTSPSIFEKENTKKAFLSSEVADEGEWSVLDSLGDFEGFDESDGTLADLITASSGKNMNNMEKDIIDAVVSETSSSDVTPEAKSETESMEKKKQSSKSKDKKQEQGGTRGGDFAVLAAKAAAAKQKTKMKSNSGGGDFAVEAAKAAAKKIEKDPKSKKELVEKEEQKSTKTNESSRKITTVAKDAKVTMGKFMPMELPTIGRSPMLDNLSKRSGSSAFQVKVSNAKKYNRRSKIFEEAMEEKSRRTETENLKRKSINLLLKDTVDTNILTEEDRKKKLDQVPFEKISYSRLNSSSSSSTDKKKVTKTDAEIEQDILKAALEIMPGSLNEDDPEGSMTAEELLKSILKFGDEKKEEEADGNGFVRGAYSKAKELSSGNQKIGNVGFKDVSKTSNPMENVKYEDDIEVSKEKLTPEEELKRIFAAGESIAESRITSSKASKQNSLASKSAASRSRVDDQYIDDLIGSDKTVPRNARTLDDELAELEVRISKSPGEDSDAYGPNPVFDIFSGPETYNPNVDPLTAVNWPGALPGSRTDVKLPQELSDAIKSAKFAASLLSKIVEETDGEQSKVFYIEGKKISDGQVERLRRAVEEGVAVGLIEDPFQYMQEKARLQILVNELVNQPEERFGEIATFYKDILLSDNFVILLKENLKAMADKHLDMKRSGEDSTELEEQHRKERDVLGKLVKYAQLLLKEAQALGAELETTQLEVIRSICNVAMDPNHKTEEETSIALKDAVRDMKPLLDESFIAYLKYAISEEEARLARAGLLDDPEHNRWLFVLKIVQEGVYSELAVGVQRYIDHIGYVLRMETKQERKQLLAKFIDVMPSLDVRPFIKVVDNIAASLGQGRKGDFDTAILGGMTNKILQLRRDVYDLLPPERIKEMSKEADEWAARQKQKLIELRRVSKQRLKAARESTSSEEELQRRGEVERFT